MVDAMAEIEFEGLGLRVTHVLRNGRRRFDAASKERLVSACLRPGSSISGLALAHGVNANLLRKWVGFETEGDKDVGRSHLTPALQKVDAALGEFQRVTLVEDKVAIPNKRMRSLCPIEIFGLNRLTLGWGTVRLGAHPGVPGELMCGDLAAV